MPQRWVVRGVVAAAVSVLVSTQASAAPEGYELAQRCYVANAYTADLFRKRGDTTNGDAFDKKARDSFDIAFVMGKALNLSHDQVLSDIRATQNAELPRLVREPGYLTKIAKACKAASLM